MPGQKAAVMFACRSCGKTLKVAAESAGKKVKCPNCGKVMPAAPNSPVADLTQQPKDGSEEKTLAPKADTFADPRFDNGQSSEKAEHTEFLAPPHQPDELGRLGPYRVLKVLGAGGMGVVFKAEDPHLERAVALKAMLPALAASASAKKRFLREAKTAAGIKHPHVVTIHQVGEDRGAPYLAMEFLEGQSLDDRLKSGEKMQTTEVLHIGRQIAEGLAAAHKQGLMHRDIKPANIWLETRDESGRTKDENVPASEEWTVKSSGEPHVKILDFGLARETNDEAHLTQPGAIIGTVAYMAPEQARGQGDQRCDLFSLGCVLYRMATGQAPFKGNDTVSLLAAIALDNPQPPRELNMDVPASLSDLIMQLLAKEPNDRPATARAVADRLAALAQELPAPARAAETMVRFPAKTIKDTPVLPLPAPRARWPRPLLAVLVATLFLGPLSYLFGSAVFRIVTNTGVLVIESNDPNIVVTIKDQTATLHDKVKGRTFVLTAGDYDVLVQEQGEGGLRFASRKFTITRNGKVVFVAILEVPPPPPDPRPGKDNASNEKPVLRSTLNERQAAHWLLSHRCTLRIAEGAKERDVRKVDELPTSPFQVVHFTGVASADGAAFTDADMAYLAPLTNLKKVSLYGQKVKDAGLAQLEPLTKLEELDLTGLPINGSGLVHLRAMKNLKTLKLSYCRYLNGSELAHLEPLTGLQYLDLIHADLMTNADLRHLGRLTSVTKLVLHSVTNLSDAGVEQLKTLTNLTYLDLTNTKVTDDGLKHLKALTRLKTLFLDSYGGVSFISNAGLVHLKELPCLERLKLVRTNVSNEGLIHLHSLPFLADLEIGSAKITNDGMVHLKGCKNLKELKLSYSSVTDRGLREIATFTQLNFLSIYGNENKEITDEGLAPLVAMPRLIDLELWYTTGISDAGLEHLKKRTNWVSVNLTGTGVTRQGVEALRKALPSTNVTWSPPAK